MRGGVAKTIRGKAYGATTGAPYAEYFKGRNGEFRLKQGTTRWMIKQTKKQRRKIITNGQAPWQQDKIHGRR